MSHMALLFSPGSVFGWGTQSSLSDHPPNKKWCTCTSVACVFLRVLRWCRRQDMVIFTPTSRSLTYIIMVSNILGIDVEASCLPLGSRESCMILPTDRCVWYHSVWYNKCGGGIFTSLGNKENFILLAHMFHVVYVRKTSSQGKQVWDLQRQTMSGETMISLRFSQP